MQNPNNAFYLGPIREEVINVYKVIFQGTFGKRYPLSTYIDMFARGLRNQHQILTNWSIPPRRGEHQYNKGKAHLLVDNLVVVQIRFSNTPISDYMYQRLRTFLIDSYKPVGFLFTMGTMRWDFRGAENRREFPQNWASRG